MAARQYLEFGGVSGGHGERARGAANHPGVEQVSGQRVPFLDLPRRAGDPAKLVDAQGVVRQLNWSRLIPNLLALCRWRGTGSAGHMGSRHLETACRDSHKLIHRQEQSLPMCRAQDRHGPVRQPTMNLSSDVSIYKDTLVPLQS